MRLVLERIIVVTAFAERFFGGNEEERLKPSLLKNFYTYLHPYIHAMWFASPLRLGFFAALRENRRVYFYDDSA